MMGGISTNLSLMETHLAPILSSIESLEYSNEFLDWFFSYTSGRPFEYMLKYFYQDWSGSEDFVTVKDLVTKALIEECGHSIDSVAVLGCGACGLLYHIARHTRNAYGIDLALPTLLSAKSLIEGHGMTFNLPDAAWQSIRIEAPQPITNVRLISADVTRLPFDDQTISVVVTQFLLDLVGDIDRFASEISRVLDENGLWINFSVPISVPGDPVEFGVRSPKEMEPLLEKLGFSVVLSERKRFKLWNFSSIYDGGLIADHECHFFVVRKSKNSLSENRDIFSDYFLGGNRAIWETVPRIIGRREISIIKRQMFNTGYVAESIQVNVKSEWLPIEKINADLLELILGNMDGSQTVSNIYEKVIASGAMLSEDDFIEFILAMIVYYSLIDIS
ncbi:class I SAM-dependent methyltransferase [Methylocaldum sp. MU1018]